MPYLDFKRFDIYNCLGYICKHRTNFIKCGDPGKYQVSEKMLSSYLNLFFSHSCTKFIKMN